MRFVAVALPAQNFFWVNILKLGSNSIWFWDIASGSTKPQDKLEIFGGMASVVPLAKPMLCWQQ